MGAGQMAGRSGPMSDKPENDRDTEEVEFIDLDELR